MSVFAVLLVMVVFMHGIVSDASVSSDVSVYSDASVYCRMFVTPVMPVFRVHDDSVYGVFSDAQ